jgi:4-hydroxy-2-oxoheptanedioate aldolase
MRPGEPSFGVLATIPSVQVVQVLANSGLDWMLVDMEHGPIGIEAAHAMIVATSGTPMVPSSSIPRRCATSTRS